MRILDSHVHYWQPDVPVEELVAEAAAAGVDQVVGITLRLQGEDNSYMLEGAQRFPERIAAVFGRVDPRGDDLDARLDALVANPKFAGVRFALFSGGEPSWLVDGTLDRFLAAAAERNLAVAIYYPRPRELGQLAARHPACTVLVDHLSLDHRGALADPAFDAFAPWDDVLALAAVANVRIKLSNLPELSRRPFPFDDMLPRVQALYDAFGPQRLIWGSNFPPSKECASYAESVQFFAELPGIPEADKAQIMGGNLLEIIQA